MELRTHGVQDHRPLARVDGAVEPHHLRQQRGGGELQGVLLSDRRLRRCEALVEEIADGREHWRPTARRGMRFPEQARPGTGPKGSMKDQALYKNPFVLTIVASIVVTIL